MYVNSPPDISEVDAEEPRQRHGAEGITIRIDTTKDTKRDASEGDVDVDPDADMDTETKSNVSPLSTGTYTVKGT